MGGVSPPKKFTVIISAILLIIGLIIGIVAVTATSSSIPAFIPGFDGTGSLFVVGLGFQGFSWFLFFMGTRLRGL
ncbi:MAG: hypothetical protein GYA24_25425 [Candidatus Lokiarchaeota archaeon]|nr:hypothetical protein [Candidatus Lokiarchaeota archaeon]